jgi:hypothetical protein
MMVIVLVHILILSGVPRWLTGASGYRLSSCRWNTRTLRHARPLCMRSSGDYSAGVPRLLCHACAKCWNRAKNVREGGKTHHQRAACSRQLSVTGRSDQGQGMTLTMGISTAATVWCLRADDRQCPEDSLATAGCPWRGAWTARVTRTHAVRRLCRFWGSWRHASERAQ